MIIDPVCVTAVISRAHSTFHSGWIMLCFCPASLTREALMKLCGEYFEQLLGRRLCERHGLRVWGKRVTAGTADKLAAASLVTAALSAAAACLAVTKAETRPTESQGTLSVPSCPTGCSHPAPSQPCLSKVQHLDPGPPWGHVWYLAHSEGYSTAVILRVQMIRSRRCLLALRSWLHVSGTLQNDKDTNLPDEGASTFIKDLSVDIKGFGLRTSYFPKCTSK